MISPLTGKGKTDFIALSSSLNPSHVVREVLAFPRVEDPRPKAGHDGGWLLSSALCRRSAIGVDGGDWGVKRRVNWLIS